MKKVRTRYAPSPTGHLHIGNARTAMYTYLFARHHGGDFIIRIEDTDIARNVENGEQSQFRYLNWLGVEWNEGPDKGGDFGPYRQLERLEIYNKYVDQLLASGNAYKCYCTEEELAAEREAQAAQGIMSPRYSKRCLHLTDEEKAAFEATRKFSIRINVPENETYAFDDIVRGNISFESKDIGDWVAIKQNGIPTYNFACVIDDYLMEISHVFRGEEHISNTPRQMMVYKMLGFEVPTFAHMAIIVNENKKKLSKRDESIMQFIEQYEKLGYLPEAMFNFIGLLGWSPVGEEEIFSKQQFIDMFDAKRLASAPAMFDKEKLKWINNRYFKTLTTEQLFAIVLPFLTTAYPTYDVDYHKQVIMLYKDQLSYGQEIVELAQIHYQEFNVTSEAILFLQENEAKKTVEILLAEIEKGYDVLTSDDVKSIVGNVKEKAGVKGKQLFMPLRIATTGVMSGPDLNSVIALYSKDELINRIKKVLEEL